MSTLSTPNNEEELEAARDVLRAVISGKAAPSPMAKSALNASTQTDGVRLEGLIKAAGMAMSNFAAEIKSLERKIDSQHAEILKEIKKIQ